MKRESSPEVAAGYVGIIFLAILAVLVFFGARALVRAAGPDDFTQSCHAHNGHVYTMDADHRVCLRNGKVISR